MSTNFNKIDRAAAFNPISAFPLDARSYFESYAAADEAAKTAMPAGSTDSNYFYGQLVGVVEEGKASYYIIQPNKTLKRINDSQIFTDSDGKITFNSKVEIDANGNVTIPGNLTVSGDSIESKLENVFTPQNTITLRDGATTALLNNEYTGLIAEKYDGTNNGMLVFDNKGTAYVGDSGDLQPLATRDLSTDGSIPMWDSSKSTLTGSPIQATENKISLNGDTSVAGSLSVGGRTKLFYDSDNEGGVLELYSKGLSEPAFRLRADGNSDAVIDNSFSVNGNIQVDDDTTSNSVIITGNSVVIGEEKNEKAKLYTEQDSGALELCGKKSGLFRIKADEESNTAYIEGDISSNGSISSSSNILSDTGFFVMAGSGTSRRAEASLSYEPNVGASLNLYSANDSDNNYTNLKISKAYDGAYFSTGGSKFSFDGDIETDKIISREITDGESSILIGTGYGNGDIHLNAHYEVKLNGQSGVTIGQDEVYPHSGDGIRAFFDENSAEIAVSRDNCDGDITLRVDDGGCWCWNSTLSMQRNRIALGSNYCLDPEDRDASNLVLIGDGGGALLNSNKIDIEARTAAGINIVASGSQESYPDEFPTNTINIEAREGKTWYDTTVPGEINLKANSINAISDTFNTSQTNTVGLKGFYWQSIKPCTTGEHFDLTEIELGTVLYADEGAGEPLFGINKDFKISDFWNVGDRISIHIDTKFLDFATIASIDDDKKTIIINKHYYAHLPSIKYEYDVTDNAVYVLAKPNAGLVDFGMGAVAFGEHNNSISYMTFNAGMNNTAKGQYSANFGKNNWTGYCSLTNGRDNHIDSDHTFATGAYNTSEAEANASILFGSQNNNHTAGKRSIVGGEYNHNYNVDSAIFGTSNTNRGEDAIISGNSNTNEGSFAIVSGSGVTNTGSSAIVIGTNGTFNDKNTSIAVGENVRNTGWHSAVFGGNNSNEGASYSLVAGTQNTNKGGRSLVVGESNENNGAYALVTGFDNTNYANKAIVNGQGCQCRGENSILSGNNCHCVSAGTIVVGQSNNSVYGSNSAIFGGYNQSDGGFNSLIAGASNKAWHSFVFIVGEGHESTRTHQTLIGSYSNPSANTLFAVGNGASNKPKNAFEVTENGDIIVNGVTLTGEKLTKIIKFIDSIEEVIE